MSLVSLLEGCKDVALAKREELAAQAAQDVAEFEEYGTDMVRGPQPVAHTIWCSPCPRTRAFSLTGRRL